VTKAGVWEARRRCTRSRVVHNGVPSERKRTEEMAAVCADSTDEGGESMSSRECSQTFTESGLFGPFEVGLLAGHHREHGYRDPCQQRWHLS
jgi:hypothetical protein